MNAKAAKVAKVAIENVETDVEDVDDFDVTSVSVERKVETAVEHRNDYVSASLSKRVMTIIADVDFFSPYLWMSSKPGDTAQPLKNVHLARHQGIVTGISGVTIRTSGTTTISHADYVAVMKSIIASARNDALKEAANLCAVKALAAADALARAAAAETAEKAAAAAKVKADRLMRSASAT